MSLFPTFKSVFKMLKTMNEGQPKLAQQVEQTQIVLSFSQQYKNNNINIENDGKIAICNSPELYKNHFVICEQKIPKNGCFSFSFKIGGWVMIGVCDKQKILEQKYIAQFEQSYGHGCYLIENDGTLYSSLKIEKNSEKAFSYTEYDIVSVLIDMDQKLIKWKKLNKTENFEMKIETSDDLYPCIGLGQAWVEII
ncbi:unnamed protein product [Paramecium pentaurelia]|uniref:SPRY domain-containing protein n=1 Tax=Paramecium pentaurelia TaxID=43138 RepID=A0A8S1VU72_9CILI|nr:unnamed protein product [Paramecium pentaurelia]